MKLFGHKKWYEEKEEGKRYFVKKRLKKENYQILTAEDNKKIDEELFIEKLKNYKKRSNKICLKRKELEIIGEKFSKSNILFKIKNKEFRNISILKQSKELGIYNQENKNTSYTRDNYERVISTNYKDNYIKVEGKIIFIFDNENEYTNSEENFKILYRIVEMEENTIRKDIYKKCKNINEEIFNILKNLVSREYSKRNFIEYYIQEVNENSLDEIFKKFKELKDICSDNENLYKELKFYLSANKNNYKVSDIKKTFVSKLENYFLYDVELKKEDISEFLVKEAVFYDILKRQEKVKCNKESWIKIYIRNDKHNSYLDNDKNKNTTILQKIKESEKIRTIQDLLQEDIQSIIDDIFNKYKIESLVKKLKNEKINDTNLFGVYKMHYKNNVESEIKDYLNKEKKDCKRLVAKIIYRYIKGRIEKIITYKCKNNLDNIFKKDDLKNKILKKIEQYIIENLIYLGKVKILDKKRELNEKNISKKFMEYGIKEELELEFLNFVSATNLKLNELFRNEKNEKVKFDYFANKLDEITKHFNSLDISKSKIILQNRINFDIDNFKSYLERMTIIRSEIIHRGNSKKKNLSIFDYYKNSKKITLKLEKDCKNIIEKINELKITDEEICKGLNFDILFNNKNMKEIIENINNIKIGNTNTIYFPNYSRLVPRIENELRKAVSSKNFNDVEFSILKNAFIYLNKVLYYKIITKEDDKENEYKNAQIRASKGEKKAIRKFQNKFIDKYLEKIRTEYIDLFNFDYLKNIELEISRANTGRNLDKKYILKSNSKDIIIKNDFEYIIIVSALIMNENTYINKFRNRLFSTFTALETMDSDIENLKDIQNLIEILDIIISINKGKRDYRNEQLLSDNTKIDKIKKEIENITLTKEDCILIVKYYKEKLFKDKMLKNVNEFCKKYDGVWKNLFETNNLDSYCKKYGIELMYRNTIQNILKEIEELKNSNNLIDFFREKKEVKLSEETENLKKIRNFLQLESYKEILDKYTKVIKDITKDDKEDKRKFEKLYYQENDVPIYKKNLFYYINQDSFQKIYREFLEDDLKVVSTDKIKNNTDIVKKIDDINKILSDINNYTQGFSKEYKNNFAKNIENFFTKRKYNEIKSFEEFKKIYSEIREYKKDKEIVEMSIIGKLMNYLTEVSWKLAIQISRIERDIDYLYNGVIELEPRLKINNNKKEANERLEIVLEFCRTNKNNKHFKSLEYLKNDLEKKGRESTRNRVAHFEMLQNPFKLCTLTEIINEVSKLSEYRSRYNNAVYNSCFEVFKRDFDLNYENLKKRFELSHSSNTNDKDKKNIKTFKIKDILSPKKVSILDLEENNELFTKIEKFFEYRIEPVKNGSK